MRRLDRVTTIRRLTPDDAISVAKLRQVSLEEQPLAFGSSPGDDSHGTAEALRASLTPLREFAILGAFEDDGRLVGMVGVERSSKAKRRHKAVVWGMYVSPDSRRRGIGRGMLEAAIRCAREWPGVEQLLLSVTTAAPGARHLYESIGFREWGREPRGIAWEGRAVDEMHFVLELHESEPICP